MGAWKFKVTRSLNSNGAQDIFIKLNELRDSTRYCETSFCSFEKSTCSKDIL